MTIKVEIDGAIEDIKGTTGITDTGDPDYTLKLNVQMTPGDYARLMNLQRQRVPMKFKVYSDQALMDLAFVSYGAKADAPTKDEAVKVAKQVEKALSGSAN